MIVCIPTTGQQGFADSVCEHFGSAPYFVLYDTDADESRIITNRFRGRGLGGCRTLGQFKGQHVECVICAGIGGRAAEILADKNITIYHSDTDSIQEALDRLKAGTLAEIDLKNVCGGGMGNCHQGERGGGRGRGMGPGQRGGRRGGRMSQSRQSGSQSR